MALSAAAAAKAAKLAATDPETKPIEKKKKKAAPTTGPVRLSVDISSVPYRNLMNFCQDVAMEIGRVRVQHVWVMRAVLAELLEDKELQRRVIERVEEEHGPNAK
jgi:hypothetical protein